LDQACIGSISEVFDAEPPFTPRGCIAQAWSVAELLRAWIKFDMVRLPPSPSNGFGVTTEPDTTEQTEAAGRVTANR